MVDGGLDLVLLLHQIHQLQVAMDDLLHARLLLSHHLVEATWIRRQVHRQRNPRQVQIRGRL